MEYNSEINPLKYSIFSRVNECYDFYFEILFLNIRIDNYLFKRMMKVFLFWVFFLFSFSVFSQEKIDNKSIRPLVFDNKTKILGINAILSPSFFFDRPETLPMELIYRRFNGSNQAFRVRLEGRYDKYREENLPFFEEKWNSSLGGGVGYEWHRPISRPWSWFYGAELAISYFWFDVDYARPTDFLGIPMILILHEDIRSIAISPRGLIGVFYNLNSKLFISFQQQLGVSFGRFDRGSIGDLNPLDPEIIDIYGAPGDGDLYVQRNNFIVQSNFGFHFKF